MSSKQRREVWAGTRTRTSGGLTKSMMVKNKRGKLVSKKKSTQAASQNNLGSWLRTTGKKVAKSEMLRKKSEPPSADKKGGGPKAKVAPKAKPAPKPAPKPPRKKAAPKAAPKPAPKPKAKPAQKRAPKAKAPKAKAIKKKRNINPLTNQPYDPKAKGKISLDNVRVREDRGDIDLGSW